MKLFILVFLCFSHSFAAADYVARPKLPERKPLELKAIGKFGPGAEKENSGIVKSRFQDDLFWTINDSGDEPRVYPVRRDGSVWGSERYDEVSGILIGGGINVDWEDIAVDDAGHLIVCDVGNNRNDRRDLVLYYLSEPSPVAGRTSYLKKVFFRYPDQHLYPAPSHNFNFDCEGVFCRGETVYIISKNRSDTLGKLYRLDKSDPYQVNELTYLDAFDFGGKTTAADASIDGRKLVVTTYDAVWVFVVDGTTDMYFRGKVYWMPFEAPQVEAVCWEDDDTLLLADETAAEIYRVEFSDLERVDKIEFKAIN
ncbi:MAG: hypothetical protein AAGB46_14050 [Verrucomicrobiota bacterium]